MVRDAKKLPNTQPSWSICSIRRLFRKLISYAKFHSFFTVSHWRCMVFVCFALFRPSFCLRCAFFVCVTLFCLRYAFLFLTYFFDCGILFYFVRRFFLCITLSNLLMFAFFFAFSFLFALHFLIC